MSKKDVAIGIPAFHAIETIKDTLASIQIQSYKTRCQVIIANDDPADNGKYDFLKTLYPDLEIITVNCDKNAGPGIARQRALDACTAEWITFIDADDIFISPFSIESLLDNTTPNCIEVQGPFFQEIEQGKMSVAEKQQLIQMGQGVPPRMMPRNDVTHPWVFGRLYRVSFLREAGIKFSELRAIN
jgi:glycosyltransferase involved in cell wall biosynthesis